MQNKTQFLLEDYLLNFRMPRFSVGLFPLQSAGSLNTCRQEKMGLECRSPDVLQALRCEGTK